mgnify:CR=1 FL=1|jgi:hypothetical protein
MNSKLHLKGLDQDAARTLRERLAEKAAILRAQLTAAGKPVQTPPAAKGEPDLLAQVEGLAAYVGSLAAQLGQADPTPGLISGSIPAAGPVHETTKEHRRESPQARAGQTATEKALAGKPAWSLPPRRAGESLTAFCARVNREKAKQDAASA